MRMGISLALIAMILGSGLACRTMTGESAGRNIDDASITSSVKAKLAAKDRFGSLTSIGVKTVGGTVYLTGSARSDAERSQAESLARNTNGVSGVVDEINVPAAATGR